MYMSTYVMVYEAFSYICMYICICICIYKRILTGWGMHAPYTGRPWSRWRRCETR